MTVFADSSALVKLYADEVGHEVVRTLTTLAVSQMARVEVPAAIWRKQRIGEIDATDARLLVDEFEADYFGTENELPRFAAVVVHPALLDEAARLSSVHALRANDAVQLSSALVIREVDASCSTIAAFDESLRVAASREGFALVP